MNLIATELTDDLTVSFADALGKAHAYVIEPTGFVVFADTPAEALANFAEVVAAFAADFAAHAAD